MSFKYLLKLRSSSPPHLYLDTIKSMIKDDKVLYPQTRKMLLLMKRYNKSFIQLPLQMDVIISPENKCNLERGISPQLLNFSLTDWNKEDTENYKNDKDSFLNRVKELYNKMGYDIEEKKADEKIVLDIIKSTKEKEASLIKKLGV